MQKAGLELEGNATACFPAAASHFTFIYRFKQISRIPFSIVLNHFIMLIETEINKR